MATAGLSTHQFDDAAIRGRVKSAFRHRYEEKTPVYKMCGFESDTTDAPFEEYTSFTGIGLAPRREEFQQVAIDVPKQNYTKRVNVLSYAIMVPVSDEALRFLKRNKLPIRTFLKPSQLVAESLAETKEVLASEVFGNAFDSTYAGMDGQPLVSATHKLGRSGTASNYIGNVSLSQEGIEAALIQGRKMPSDVGLPIGVGDEEKIILTQEDLTFDLERILDSTLQSDTANNAKNVLKGKKLKPASNRYLPSVSNWFIINTGVKDGLIELTETDADMRDFGDEKTHTMYFEAYMMIAFDWFEWRRVQGSNF
jgi:hypothetical protein